MERLGDIIWNPWLIYGLIGFAATATILLRAPQFRGWVAFIRARRATTRNATAKMAAAAGVGGLAGAVVAVDAGGPGALFWLALGLVLALAVHFAESSVALRTITATDGARDALPSTSGSGHGGLVAAAQHSKSRLARALALPIGLATVLTAFWWGGIVQVHQAAHLLHESFTVLPLAGGIAATLVLVVLVGFAPLRRFALALAPWGLAAYLLLGVAWLARDTWAIAWVAEQAWAEAFRLRPVAAGFVGTVLTVSVAHGVAWLAFAAQPGLGVAAMAVEPGESREPGLAHATMAGAAMAGATAIVTALVLLTTPVTATAWLDDATLLPLERPASRGLRPNADVGQVIVLPDDAGFETDSNYAMVLRSNPRGHSWPARLTDKNSIVAPTLQILSDVDTVVFRPKDPKLAPNPAWDVRVAVKRKTKTVGDHEVLELEPVESDVSFKALIERYDLADQPYLVVGDFPFVGAVGSATAQAIGRHLGMYERRPPDAPRNPDLHEFFRVGYRGPYLDLPTPRAPWAWVAPADLDAAPGTVIPLQLRAPERGAAMLTVTATGELQAPPWDFIGGANMVILRHDDDPTLDRFIAASPHFDGRRWTFAPPEWLDDWKQLETLAGYSGLFLVAPRFDFEVEVRSGKHFPGEGEDRQALVPLVEPTEPSGPPLSLPYAPHPHEVLQADMQGPVLRHEGARAIAARFVQAWGWPGGIAVTVVALLLALSAAAAWCEFGSRAWGAVLGGRASWLFTALFFAAAAGAASLSFDTVMGTAKLLFAVLLVPNLLLLFVSLPRAGGDRDTPAS